MEVNKMHHGAVLSYVSCGGSLAAVNKCPVATICIAAFWVERNHAVEKFILDIAEIIWYLWESIIWMLIYLVDYIPDMYDN
jgi:hypothetical protein